MDSEEKAVAAETVARQDAVKQLLASETDTQKQLGMLNTQTVVQAEQTKQISATLDKISAQLSNLTVTTVPMSGKRGNR